ncbi:serine repeat antigen, putative [Hepatocystis sp. ex Piliocolobus tephrosceles]|nr:serine repeat antigen, putative [Hepatocystis sp. ex Piliocolobus tephrosceles]
MKQRREIIFANILLITDRKNVEIRKRKSAYVQVYGKIANENEPNTDLYYVTANGTEDQNHVIIIGKCGAIFYVFFNPYFLIRAKTMNNQIQIKSQYSEHNIKTSKMEISDYITQFEEDLNKLQNKCKNNKYFVLELDRKDEDLKMAWEVFDDLTKQIDKKRADTRNIHLHSLDEPFTSIDVFTAKSHLSGMVFEDQHFELPTDMPSECSKTLAKCILNNNLDVEKCYACHIQGLQLTTNISCLMYSNYPIPYLNFDQQMDTDNEKKKQKKEEPKQNDLTSSFLDDDTDPQDKPKTNAAKLHNKHQYIINNIFEYDYQKDESQKKCVKEWHDIENNDDLTKAISESCQLNAELDKSETYSKEDIPDIQTIYKNIKTLLDNNIDDDYDNTLVRLTNPAVCLKNVDDYLNKRLGLSLSKDVISVTIEEAKKELKEDNDKLKKKQKKKKKKYDNIHVVKKTDDYYYYTVNRRDLVICNYEHCDRRYSYPCVVKIETYDQGACTNSWLFASKLHLELFMCMNGYEYSDTSALYIAHCSGSSPTKKCTRHSDANEYLNVIKSFKYLPLNKDHPYEVKNVNDECHGKLKFPNMLDQFKKDKNQDLSLFDNANYKLYISTTFKNNMDTFNNIIKKNIILKGSVIAYVNAKNNIDYKTNGLKVLNKCGNDNPDLAVVAIGFGSYFDEQGNKRDYWIMKNSWGYYWADGGQFKVDIDGPKDCPYHFIHSIAVFDIDIPEHKNTNDLYPNLKLYYAYEVKTIYEELYSLLTNSKSSDAIPGNNSQNNSNTKTTQQQHVTHIVIVSSDDGTKKKKSTYKNFKQFLSPHNCSKSTSIDDKPSYVCSQFCKKHWGECKNEFTPGYCLMSMREKNDCNFCYV